ncbi:MAG: ATP-dependent helicase UvrD/PcrA, partial [Thermomicrobiales bacterium]|nr:ATP-dependent helicase UvrD/PcrA [Thermomicrobiales bacterium]
EDLLVAVALGKESLEGKLDPDRVNILTMHQAKGLEADVVFLMAAEDEIMPRAESAAAVEDDRRLLYVSMTRAKERLFITYSGLRTGPQMYSGRNPSERRRTLTRFLRGGPLRVTPGGPFIQAWDR